MADNAEFGYLRGSGRQAGPWVAVEAAVVPLACCGFSMCRRQWARMYLRVHVGERGLDIAVRCPLHVPTGREMVAAHPRAA